MQKNIHPNYIKSSYLIFSTVGLGLISLLFSSVLLNTGQNITISMLTLLNVTLISFLVSQGKVWVKYLLVVLAVVGLLGILSIINNFSSKPVIGIINIADVIIQIWAIILLFTVPKNTDYKANVQ